jgi:hypothetical protein
MRTYTYTATLPPASEGAAAWRWNAPACAQRVATHDTEGGAHRLQDRNGPSSRARQRAGRGASGQRSLAGTTKARVAYATTTRTMARATSSRPTTGYMMEQAREPSKDPSCAATLACASPISFACADTRGRELGAAFRGRGQTNGALVQPLRTAWMNLDLPPGLRSSRASLSTCGLTRPFREASVMSSCISVIFRRSRAFLCAPPAVAQRGVHGNELHWGA